MQRGGLAVDADVGDVSAGPDESGASSKVLGYADRLDRDVGSEAVGEPPTMVMASSRLC